MSYKHLTLDERYQIYAFKKAGFKQNKIAEEVGVSESTISRELARNKGQKGYRPKQAQRMADDRKQNKQKKRIKVSDWKLVESCLLLQWSPEQISGRMKLEGKLSVSHEWIYNYIYKEKKAGGNLYKNLRCQKRRRKRYGKNSRRGQIPNRRSIDTRPKIVDKKSRLGDWEADTIIGKNHTKAIVSLVERKSKYCFLKKVESKTSSEVKEAICSLLESVSNKVFTITSDNGREFAEHEEIAKHLESDFYFAHPYHSWERGLNENTNGLVRQYFPKAVDFSNLADSEIESVMEKLNNRPRKTLGYRTPNQIFFKEHKIALIS